MNIANCRKLIASFIILSTTTLAGEDKMTLNFGWTPGLDIHVTSQTTKERSSSQGRSSQTINGTYRIQTSKLSKGLAIKFHEIKFEEKNKQQSENRQKLKQFLEKISQIEPTYVVDDSGKLVDIDGLKALQQIAQTEMAVWFVDIPTAEREQIQQLVASILSKEQLMSRINEEWNGLVAQWSNTTLEKGATYKIEFKAPIPMLDYAELPGRGYYQYMGKVPCNAADKHKGCVELHYNSSLDEKETKIFMDRFFQKMNMQRPPQAEFKTDYELTIITEPDTLLPHSVNEIRIVSAPGRGSEVVEQKQIKKEVYTYK